jgi:hypothetical protein
MCSSATRSMNFTAERDSASPARRARSIISRAILLCDIARPALGGVEGDDPDRPIELPFGNLPYHLIAVGLGFGELAVDTKLVELIQHDIGI